MFVFLFSDEGFAYSLITHGDTRSRNSYPTGCLLPIAIALGRCTFDRVEKIVFSYALLAVK